MSKLWWLPMLAMSSSLLCADVIAGEIPGWATETMRESRHAIYIVGIGTEKVLEKAEQAAVHNATAKALAFIGEQSSSHSQMQRDEGGTRFSSVFESRSVKTVLRGKTIEKRYVHNLLDGGYQVFVQVRYPRHVLHQAKREAANAWRKHMMTVKSLIARAELAWRTGEMSAVLTLLNEARALADKTGDPALMSRVTSIEAELLGSIRVRVMAGDDQRVAVAEVFPDLVIIKVTSARFGERPLMGVPLRARWQDTDWHGVGITDNNGELHLRSQIQIMKAGIAVIGIDVDWAALGKDEWSDVGTEVRFMAKIIRTSRKERVALQVEERNLGKPVEHSLLMDAMVRSLTEAGFRVIGETVNLNARDRMAMAVMNSNLLTSIGYKSPARADIVVKGWIETHYNSDNDGWIESVQPRAALQAVSLSSGETLVQIEGKGLVAFGSTAESAGTQGREALARSLADRLVKQLVARITNPSMEGP